MTPKLRNSLLAILAIVVAYGFSALTGYDAGLADTVRSAVCDAPAE